MDFHSMKRKQLQALCKEHKIPANLKNLEMADRLAALHKEGENQVIEEVVVDEEESVEEIEAKDVVLSKNSKKVRFSPDHEVIEFTRVPQVKRTTRRNSVYHRESNWSVEVDESSGSEGTGELKLVEAGVKQKNGGTKAIRSNASKRGRGSAKDDAKKALSNVKNKEQQEEVVQNRRRVTRSTAQKLTEAPVVEVKVARTSRKNKSTIAAPRAVTDDNGASGIGESLISDVQMPASKDSELTFIAETHSMNHSMKEEFSVADESAKDDAKKALNNVKNKDQQVEVVQNRRRVTRSTAQKLTEAPAVEVKVARTSRKNKSKIAAPRAVTDDNGASGIEESLISDVQMPASKDSELTFIAETHSMKEEFSVADESAKDVVFESSEADYTHPKSTSELKTPLSGMTKHHVDNVTEENESFFHNGRASQLAEAEADITPQVDSQVAEDDCGIDEEASADASISDIKSCSSIKIVTESIDDVKFQDTVESEGKHQNLLARQTDLGAGEGATHAILRQSWTETELQKLFRTSDEDSRGSETKNMTMSKRKSTASYSCSLAKDQEKEIDGESSNKCAEAKDNSMVLPSQSDADIYEHGLKVLFATPVKNMTPCETEETYLHEIVATESLSYEKAQNAGHDVENNLNVGASLSDDGGDNICKGIDEVETFELPNTSTRVPSGAVHEICEALEDQLVQNKEESLQEADSRREDMEEHAIPLAESSLIDEAIENNVISTSGSPQVSNKIENYSGMSKVESDADIQMSGVSDDCHLDSSLDDNILREAPAETSSDSDVAKIISSEKDATEKGMPLSILSEATPDPDCEDLIFESDDQCGAEKLDEKDGNPKSDELHSNSEAAVQETPFGYMRDQELDQLQPFDELESTSKDAQDMEMTTQILCNTDAAAENGSFVNGAAPIFGSDSGKVQDAECELEKSVCSGDILPDGGGEDSCGMMNDVESMELKVTSAAVFSTTDHEVCEASEKLVESTGKCQKETNFMTEDNEEKIIPLGQSCLYNEEVDDDSLLMKENVISLCGTPNNLDKFESCQAMLIDTSPSEGISSESRVYHNKHEHEMPQSSEAAVELCDAGPLKSNISKDSQNVIDEATHPLLSPKASPACDELKQSTDTDDLDGAMICDKVDAEEKPSQEISVESHTNREVAVVESLLDCDNQSGEAGNIIASAGAYQLRISDLATYPLLSPKASPVCDELIQRTDIDDLDGAKICDKVHAEEKPSQEISVESRTNREVAAVESLLDCDNQCEEAGNIIASAEHSTVQFSIQELHFEENVKDFKNDTHTISNLPASLKESDVDDTIKEYIESESSLSVIFESSSASLPGDMLANTDETSFAFESSVMSKTETDLAVSDNVPPVDCLDAENKAQEGAELITRPAQVSDNAANSPEHVGFVDEGTIHNLASQKNIEPTDGHGTSSKDPHSTMRKNARTILIHGTPSKLMTMADMKENEPNHKRSNVGDITIARPAKRRALSNLQQN